MSGGENLGAWELYHSLFQDGEDVVLIDERDDVHVGRLETHEEYCLLLGSGGKSEKHCWENIAFMSHDGFPVKKLFGADGSRLIEKIDTSNVERAAREALTNVLCVKCDELVESKIANRAYGHSYYHPNCRQLVIRDPFLIENVSGVLLNSGNTGQRYWGQDREEVLVMESRDGARGMFYGLDNMFHADIVPMPRTR